MHHGNGYVVVLSCSCLKKGRKRPIHVEVDILGWSGTPVTTWAPKLHAPCCSSGMQLTHWWSSLSEFVKCPLFNSLFFFLQKYPTNQSYFTLFFFSAFSYKLAFFKYYLLGFFTEFKIAMKNKLKKLEQGMFRLYYLSTCPRCGDIWWLKLSLK